MKIKYHNPQAGKLFIRADKVERKTGKREEKQEKVKKKRRKGRKR